VKNGHFSAPYLRYLAAACRARAANKRKAGQIDAHHQAAANMRLMVKRGISVTRGSVAASRVKIDGRGECIRSGRWRGRRIKTHQK